MNEKEFFEGHYQKLISGIGPEKSVLIQYNGALNQDQITRLEGEVESTVLSIPLPKSPVKKIFFISVEALQNMLIHGHKDHDGKQHNFFVIAKNGSTVEITSANLVSNNAIPGLTSKINRINDFEDEKALKEYYMEHLSNNQMSEKGGAGLGFITIAMKSGNKLKPFFEKINDDFSLFQMTSTVNIQ
ncbi:MAG: SiaB family protein kinase [Bacteroidota bacterium]|jgi:hypothetical protein